MHAPPPDLDDIPTTCWRELVDATRDRTGFTLGFLGTSGLDGSPQVRAVILRRADPELSNLYFATDARSAKVPEIAANPRVAMTFNDNSNGVQLRATGTAEIVTDETERAAVWDSLGEHSKQMYEPEPGAERDSGATAFDNFCWIRITVDGFDRLDLSGDEHLRWRFGREDGEWSGKSTPKRRRESA